MKLSSDSPYLCKHWADREIPPMHQSWRPRIPTPESMFPGNKMVRSAENGQPRHFAGQNLVCDRCGNLTSQHCSCRKKENFAGRVCAVRAAFATDGEQMLLKTFLYWNFTEKRFGIPGWVAPTRKTGWLPCINFVCAPHSAKTVLLY